MHVFNYMVFLQQIHIEDKRIEAIYDRPKPQLV